MIRRLLIFVLCFVPSLWGQFVTITGNVTDPVSGQAYQNATGRATLISGNGQPANWTIGGTNPVRTPIIANLDSFGNFTISLTNTCLIDQQTSQPVWQFSWTSAEYANVGTVSFTGPTLALCSDQNISSQITAVPPAPLPITGGGGGGITGAVQGQPIYGTGGTTAKSFPVELAADTFNGTDICQQIMAAEAALPANGGVIRLSAKNYPACASTLILNQGKSSVTLRGAGGPGNWGLGVGATVLNFAAGVSGIVGTSGFDNMNIENLFIKSASTAAGTDDGITLLGGSPRVSRVTVQGFGRNGVVMGENTDLWRMENVYADHNRNDGFFFTPGCHDENAGMASILSATSNGNYGFELQCGGSNNFQSTHASNNATGAWIVNTTYNFFYDTYVEQGAGGTFTFAAGAEYNTAFFSGFGQPVITDLGIYGTNQIHYEGNGGTDGIYPAQTSFSLTGQPQQSPGVMYSFVAGSGAYYAGDLVMRERVGNKNVFFYQNNIGWDFLTPLLVGQDNQIAGKITIANGSAVGHTLIQTQSVGTTLFSLPANNGTSGQSLTTDGAGHTAWTTVSGGPGGGVTSVTGTGTVSCSPTTGAVVCNGTSTGTGGITNSAGVNVMMKSDGTNAIGSSITDNASTVVTTEPLTAATLTTGTGAAGCPASGCWAMTEGPTAGVGTLGVDYCRADSNTHQILCSFNGSTPETPLGGSSGAPSFSVITAGTNTAPLVVGTGGSLTATGTGTIAATSVPAAGLGAGTIANNTSGTASNLSGTPALPNGTTATTQAPGDNTTKIATDAFVLANVGTTSGPNTTNTQMIEYFCSGTSSTGNIGNLGWTLATVGSAPIFNGVIGTYPHRCVSQLSTAAAATQGQGGTITLSAGGGSQTWGDFSSNPNWSIHATFALTSTPSMVMRIGLSSLANAVRTNGMFLLYDTNSPLSAAAISAISCTATTCTVTMVNPHGLNVPGQGFTIAGETCPTRNLNATYAYGSATGISAVNTGSNFTFNSSGPSGENCTVQGTVTTNPMPNFAFLVQTSSVATYFAVDTGIAADTNWHNLTISNSTAGTIQFKLDSGSTVSISTNVPTVSLVPSIGIATDATAQKTLQLNYWSYTETGLTR